MRPAKSALGDSKSLLNTTSELSALKRDLKRLGGDVQAERQALGEGGPPLGPEKTARLAFERALLGWEVERLNRQVRQQEDFGNELLGKIRELEEEKEEELVLVRATLEEKERSQQRLGAEFADLSRRYLEERMLAEARIWTLETEVADLKHQGAELGVRKDQLEAAQRIGEGELRAANDRIASLKKTHEEELKVALARHLESLSALQREMDQRTTQLAMERTVLLSETSRSVQRVREEAEVLKQNLAKARAEHKGELFAKQAFFDEQVGSLKQQLSEAPGEPRLRDEEVRGLQMASAKWESWCRVLEAQVAELNLALELQDQGHAHGLGHGKAQGQGQAQGLGHGKAQGQGRDQGRDQGKDWGRDQDRELQGHGWVPVEDRPLLSELQDLQKTLSAKTKAEAELRVSEETLRGERDKLAVQLWTQIQRCEAAENEVAELRLSLRAANAQATKLGDQAAAAQAEVSALESRLAQATGNAEFYRKKFEAVQGDSVGRTAEFREKLEEVKKIELKYYDALDRLNKAG